MSSTKIPRLRHALTALTLALIFVSLIPARNAQAAASDLDPAFGSGGKVTTDFLGGSEAVTELLVQPDGKLIAAGQGITTLTGLDFVLARYNGDGSLDTSFGNGGKVTTDFSHNENLTGAVLQPDGKIVVVGWTVDDVRDYYIILARYNSDGNLDASFGTGGKVTTNLTPGIDLAFGVALQSDGKVVVAGLSPGMFQDAFTVIRYNTNGSLDASFGTGGVVLTPFGEGFNGFSQGFDVVIQPGDKIVVGGMALDDGLNGGFALARYNGDGSLDPSFGTAGKVVTNFGGALVDQIRCLALQPDGKIVAGGQTFDPVQQKSWTALARYNANGSLDASFGTGGLVKGNLTDYNFIFNMALQQNGRIVAAVFPTLPGQTQFAVLRYNSDGSPDTSFGPDGRVTTSINGYDVSTAIAVQADGKIVAGGSAGNPAVTTDFALVRYLGDDTRLDSCVQDDSNGNLLQFNSSTGQYVFTNCGGVTLGGIGTIMRRGNVITLQHNAADRRVQAAIDLGTHRASATLQLLTNGKTFSIT
ncbi:MAG TPA: hypothetical protein VJZ91_11815, partial [Blastocatellia bacterium]|nr:hypothetical protein [Blastocatellia bacterium]